MTYIKCELFVWRTPLIWDCHKELLHVSIHWFNLEFHVLSWNYRTTDNCFVQMCHIYCQGSSWSFLSINGSLFCALQVQFNNIFYYICDRVGLNTEVNKKKGFIMTQRQQFIFFKYIFYHKSWGFCSYPIIN